MTDTGVKRMILLAALEAEVQGMIAENKGREQDGLSMSYGSKQFGHMADEMRTIAAASDEQVMLNI